MAKWFYKNDAEQLGPVEQDELEQLIIDGHVDQDWKIWTKDFGDEMLLHKETWENILNTVGNVKAVYYCLQVLNGRRYPMHVLVAIDKNSHNDTL